MTDKVQVENFQLVYSGDSLSIRILSLMRSSKSLRTIRAILKLSHN